MKSPAYQERDDLRHALQWALSYIERIRPVAEPFDGEDAEDHSGATRLAWPDDPDQWS